MLLIIVAQFSRYIFIVTKIPNMRANYAITNGSHASKKNDKKNINIAKKKPNIANGIPMKMAVSTPVTIKLIVTGSIWPTNRSYAPKSDISIYYSKLLLMSTNLYSILFFYYY